MSEIFNQQAGQSANQDPQQQRKEEVHVTHREDGVKISNTDYAGRAYTWEDKIKGLSEQEIAREEMKYPGFKERYPEGILFSSNGRPDFAPYAVLRIEVEGMNGERAHDRGLVAKELGIRTKDLDAHIADLCRKAGLPVEKYTLHHASATTAEFIPTLLHDAVPHYGGAYEIRQEVRLTPSLEQVVQDSKVVQQKLAERDLAQKQAQKPALYKLYIENGEVLTQFSVGDGQGPPGNPDFRKEEIARMVHDPTVKTINTHDRARYVASYDRAEQAALARGATPEQARLAATERTHQVLARVEMVQEREFLRQNPDWMTINAHFNKLGHLAEQRLQDRQQQARREGRPYQGPTPKPQAERTIDTRIRAYTFHAYADLAYNTQRYGYSEETCARHRQSLASAIRSYGRDLREQHERAVAGPAYDRGRSHDCSMGFEL